MSTDLENREKAVRDLLSSDAPLKTKDLDAGVIAEAIGRLAREGRSKKKEERKELNLFEPNFHVGQMKAWEYWLEGRRVVLISSGSQGGKTAYGTVWSNGVLAEHQHEGGNFIIATPTYKIMSQSTLPTVRKLFDPMGWKLNKGDMYLWNPEYMKLRIYLRTGENPNSVEGIQDCIGAWGDEAGQFSRLFWENLQSRTSFRQSPLLLTTTPYAINWVVRDIIKPFEAGSRDVGYIHFSSLMNPAFPKDEYYRQKVVLSPEAFARRYEGLHAKMQGLVYGDYGEWVKVKDKVLPDGTVYYGGVDWGYSPDPYALVVRAITPEGEEYDVKAVKMYKRTPTEKVLEAKKIQDIYPVKLWICGHDEPGSIREFNNAGLSAIQGIVGKNSVDERIEKHTELIRLKKYFVFESCFDGLDEEYNTYYRHPENGKPMGDDHLMDATGMISHYLSRFPPRKIRPSRIPISRRRTKILSPWEL